MDESGVCLGVEVSAVVLRASAEFECQTEPVLVGRDAGCHRYYWTNDGENAERRKGGSTRFRENSSQ